MNSERWAQIERLYHEAIERAAGERASFLDEACAGDSALRREIESLLEANEDTGILDSLALNVVAKDMASEQAQAMIGRTIGHYRIISLLGVGGMGEVYYAQDMRLGRKLALKFLPQDFTRDRERVLRFRQEARAASALNHPNIITIFEIDEIDGVQFIATEYVEGQTVRQMIASDRIRIGDAIDIAIQVASALNEAHVAGIIHRDVKPENVMVRKDGFVKVLDFGLAKLADDGPAGRADSGGGETSGQIDIHTDPRIMIGTPQYMSPEQLTRKKVDYRADIFSLGAVLYEMIAARPPFSGETPGELIAAILEHEPAPLARYARSVPAELERIAGKALEKDREKRYQVVKDLMLDLRSLKLEMDVNARLRNIEGSPSQDETDTIAQKGILVHTHASPIPVALPSIDSQEAFEPVTGAVPLNSKFYLVRAADEEFRAAIARRDSSVLVKGARQVGKTSLLARGLQQARHAGANIVLTDLQKLSSSQLENAEEFYRALSEIIADQLDLDVIPDDVWQPRRGPSINFERYLRREVLGKLTAPLVWGLDEVDRLFSCAFGSEVFGLFRSWHNERALDPSGPWHKLTLAMAYATEAHLFIADLNQSPFNVGTRITLSDFTFDQVAELNVLYGLPLRDNAEVARYYRLVGGHPYLVRCGLREMTVHKMDLSALESASASDEGPFGDHLRRILISLTQDVAICDLVKGVLQGRPASDKEMFYRLRSAGVMEGDTIRDMRPRCQLYATYLEEHLL